MLPFILLFGACTQENEPLLEKAPLVVEGWIEEGESPVVIVTHAVDMTQDVVTFDGVVEKWCRVSVFDGKERYLLTGKADKNYTPSYIFTSSKLRGKSGHTYRLLVETENDTVYAESTIPAATMIEKLEVVRVENTDSLYSIRAMLGNVDRSGYYKFFTRIVSEEGRFYPSFLGTFRGEDYMEDSGFSITRGIHAAYSGEDFSHYYKKGDRVVVKICSMERDIYDFWQTYDNNVSLSGNLFFTFAANCPHTVKGAFGYWAAYGMSQRAVRIP